MTEANQEGPIEDTADFGASSLPEDLFSKRLPDDSVEYTILVIDEKITEVHVLRERLKAIQNAAKVLVKQHLSEYIWQREDFGLTLNHRSASSTDSNALWSWSLQGSTNFGDSIADEWLIVWLLKELSEQFPEAWIRLEDTDGQFLLVEAANKLPKWLNPEIADNRVWINSGRLVIIPVADAEADRASNLTLDRAIAYIADGTKDVLHDRAIEDEAFSRVRLYPGAIQSTLHNSFVRIPRRLAYILHHHPAYIAPAVDAFYLRDPISLKPLATKDTGTLQFPPEDFVTVSARFNRVGYAQLRTQDFKPPPSWTAVLPHMSEESVATGMKLTCGFEMLLQDKAHSDSRSVREIQLLLSDIESGDDTLPSDADIAKWPKRQDDDQWLHIGYEDLEREIKGEQTSKTGASTGNLAEDAEQAQLKKMMDKFQQFMADEKAGIDGVEDEDDIESSDEGDSDTENEDEGTTKEENEDEASFEDSMRKVHDLSATDAEHKALSDEARRLALEMEDEDEGTRDDDAEAEEVMRLVAQIRAQRAEKAGPAAASGTSQDKGKQPATDNNQIALSELAARAHSSTQKGFIAGKPPAKPGSSASKATPARITSLDEDDADSDQDWAEGNYEELSSDEDEGENDIDLDFLKNVLGSLSGQQGMGGPAGNLLASMGIRMPRDEEMGRGK